MTALTLPWFEDEDPRDLRRWVMAALIVFGIHAPVPIPSAMPAPHIRLS
jgi:hypothetical protein